MIRQSCFCETKIKEVQIIEPMNWSIVPGITVVGYDRVMIDCDSYFGSNIIIDYGHTKYEMDHNKFCDKMDNQINWVRIYYDK